MFNALKFDDTVSIQMFRFDFDSCRILTIYILC